MFVSWLLTAGHVWPKGISHSSQEHDWISQNTRGSWVPGSLAGILISAMWVSGAFPDGAACCDVMLHYPSGAGAVHVREQLMLCVNLPEEPFKKSCVAVSDAVVQFSAVLVFDAQKWFALFQFQCTASLLGCTCTPCRYPREKHEWSNDNNIFCAGSCCIKLLRNVIFLPSCPWFPLLFHCWEFVFLVYSLHLEQLPCRDVYKQPHTLMSWL